MRLYLMPVTGTGSIEDPRLPKYVSDVGTLPWRMMDYGEEPVCFFVVDPDIAVHGTLSSHADVTALPSDLNQQIGAQVNVVQNALDALNIPSNWVQGTHTYIQVLRVVALVFQFAQKHQGLGFGKIFTSGVTLSTQFNQLSVSARQHLLSTAQSLNFDTSSLAGSSTLRQILKAVADQFNIIEIFLGGITF